MVWLAATRPTARGETGADSDPAPRCASDPTARLVAAGSPAYQCATRTGASYKESGTKCRPGGWRGQADRCLSTALACLERIRSLG